MPSMSYFVTYFFYTACSYCHSLYRIGVFNEVSSGSDAANVWLLLLVACAIQWLYNSKIQYPVRFVVILCVTSGSPKLDSPDSLLVLYFVYVVWSYDKSYTCKYTLSFL